MPDFKPLIPLNNKPPLVPLLIRPNKLKGYSFFSSSFHPLAYGKVNRKHPLLRGMVGNEKTTDPGRRQDDPHALWIENRFLY
ncbi:MAG: hypothetical protein OEY26_09370, partial [Nitrospinota bacterium]|nr:hypothetical protein [Nitrospinota bacterium]